jgi:hypothetical protein
VWVLRIAVDFTVLPDSVDASFIGTGSAVGAVAGGLWAYFLGYSLEQIVAQGAFGALVLGAGAGMFWLMGLQGLELLK